MRLSFLVTLDTTAPEGTTDGDAYAEMLDHLADHIAVEFTRDFGPHADGGYDGPTVTATHVIPQITQESPAPHAYARDLDPRIHSGAKLGPVLDFFTTHGIPDQDGADFDTLRTYVDTEYFSITSPSTLDFHHETGQQVATLHTELGNFTVPADLPLPAAFIGDL